MAYATLKEQSSRIKLVRTIYEKIKIFSWQFPENEHLHTRAL
jgi:hypothetical protein